MQFFRLKRCMYVMERHSLNDKAVVGKFNEDCQEKSMAISLLYHFYTLMLIYSISSLQWYYLILSSFILFPLIISQMPNCSYWFWQDHWFFALHFESNPVPPTTSQLSLISNLLVEKCNYQFLICICHWETREFKVKEGNLTFKL